MKDNLNLLQFEDDLNIFHNGRSYNLKQAQLVPAQHVLSFSQIKNN
jgi:hypothetical protein